MGRVAWSDDQYHGQKMNVEEILSHYHGLWQVEDSFRIEKHDIRVRPVFHRTAKRIKAPLAICFMDFALIRFLQYKMKQKTGESFSAEQSQRRTVPCTGKRIDQYCR